MTAYALAALGEPMYGGDYGRIYSMLSIAFWWQLAVILALGIILTVINRRGPLETLVSWTSEHRRHGARQEPRKQPSRGRDRFITVRFQRW